MAQRHATPGWAPGWTPFWTPSIQDTMEERRRDLAAQELLTINWAADNPYWDAARPWHHRWTSFDLRRRLVSTFAWAIPDPETLAFVAHHLGARAVEMGAGRGYWALLLSRMGVDMRCYDRHPPDAARPPNSQANGSQANRYHGSEDDFPGAPQVFYPVRRGGPPRLGHQGDRTLLLCWPPYDRPMAARCLRAYTGRKLVYIGEGDGGCTGDHRFHALLERDWRAVDQHRPAQWDGIHDWVWVYERPH